MLRRGLCSLSVSCCVWGRRSQISPGAAGAGTHWAVATGCVWRDVSTAEGRAAGWASCGSAALCPVWVGGLGCGTGAPGSVCAGVGGCNGRGWNGAGKRAGEVLLPWLQDSSALCPVTPQVLSAGDGGVPFCCTGPLCLSHTAGLGGLAGWGDPKSQLGLHLQGTERGKGLDH